MLLPNSINEPILVTKRKNKNKRKRTAYEDEQTALFVTSMSQQTPTYQMRMSTNCYRIAYKEKSASETVTTFEKRMYEENKQLYEKQCARYKQEKNKQELWEPWPTRTKIILFTFEKETLPFNGILV